MQNNQSWSTSNTCFHIRFRVCVDTGTRERAESGQEQTKMLICWRIAVPEINFYGGDVEQALTKYQFGANALPLHQILHVR